MNGSEKRPNLYEQIIERIFFSRYNEGDQEVPFERGDMARAALEIGVSPPKNLGDLVYSFRYRTSLPDSIQAKAPAGHSWIIRPAGRSRYLFVSVLSPTISPRSMMSTIKIPDSTPEIITRYAMNDEQSLLAKIRYNRLIDIFTGVTCYSLQSHLRTSIRDIGQVETDEVYIGIDQRGAQYVFPVQAKGKTDKLSIVQIEQDFALCQEKFRHLLCRPIGAQFMTDEIIALFSFEKEGADVRLALERHYRLVQATDFTPADLEAYRSGPL